MLSLIIRRQMSDLTENNRMHLLAIITPGEYGLRHVANIEKHRPSGWKIDTWKGAAFYPPVIDYPEDYLPQNLAAADLIVSFAEHRAIAELLPDIAKMTGAKAVIAAIDNENSLPRGLARQLREWLERIDVCCVTPKPLCSLTPTDYLLARHQRVSYSNPLISEFATYFGQPSFQITVDEQSRQIVSADVCRDAVCGCARFVAEGLIGLSVDEAEERAGLLHHHFPCLAAMGKDSDFGDTLMHVSGNLLKDEVGDQIRSHKTTSYIAPGFRSEEP